MGTEMKIAFVYKGDRLGGSHISSVLVAETLKRLGADVQFAVHEAGGGVDQYLASRGHEFAVLNLPHCVPKETNSLRKFAGEISRATPSIVRYLRNAGIDIVHTNCRDMHRTWTLPTRLAGRKHVWHARGRVDSRPPERRLIRLTNLFIPISEFVKNSAPSRIRNRMVEIRNPIMRPQVDPAAVEEIRRSILGDRPGHLVGLVSRLDQPRKNADLFARTAAIMPDKERLNIHFVICGRGEPQTIERMKNLSFQARDRVHFTGFVDPVYPYMAAMDCIVAPATREPLGRVPLEAAALGIPCVALQEGGHLETIQEGVSGTLVPRADPQAFADAVLAVLQGPMKNRLKDGALIDELLAPYEPVRNAKILLDHYEQLMRN